MNDISHSQSGAPRIIGVMSGSSLDGLDIACCTFSETDKGWNYEIEQAETVRYPGSIQERLAAIPDIQGEELINLDLKLGYFIGQQVQDFIQKHKLENVSYIASHGHTVAHNPELGFSLQIGHGSTIAAITGISVIADFRSLDMELGGQGAPLVPIGDEYLFPEYDYCLNLGGYSNLSHKLFGHRIAFDICPVNKVINLLAREAGKDMDHEGAMARQGMVSGDMLDELNQLPYYQKKAPKSLGDEWFNHEFVKIINNHKDLPLNDRLRTVYEHIAVQIAQSTSDSSRGQILVTGGGTHNKFLIECTQEHNPNRLIIPGQKLIDFKEAMVFAFMGLLRSKDKINCLASATGASRDSSGGVIFHA